MKTGKENIDRAATAPARAKIRKSSMTRALAVMCTALLLFTTIASSSAQAAGLIRDAETEALIRDYAGPILKVAGLGSHGIRIHLVNNKSFNAFVVDGQNMFMHVGTLLRSETPNQVIGVIAHETGHISGGHLARLRNQIKQAKSASLMLQIIGIAALAAGAVAGGGGGNDIGEAGAAVLYGGQSVVQRTVLAYRRTQESQADQAAVTFLNATRQSSKGMIETFQYFADQGLASLRYVDPYVQSHPMPQQRITQMRDLAISSPYYDAADSPSLQLRHNLMRAKLTGFLEHPQTTFRKYPKSDQTLPARYARTIAHYKKSGIKAALPGLENLIASQPRNPYFHELKGQFLFEKGFARKAVPSLKKAVSIAPKANLIRIMLGQAMLATGDKRQIDGAIKQLRKAIGQENTTADGYRVLAEAYGKKGRTADAQLASAHRYLYEGKFSLAKQQAKRAKASFKTGTPSWIQADDILRYQPPTR